MIKTSREIHQSYRKTILEDKDIVMALRGEVGLVRMIDKSLTGTNITRGLARIAAKNGKVLPEFLLWELRSPRFRCDLMRRIGGSALQEISLSELRKVETLVPPIQEQKKIAHILSTWDKAITITEQLLTNSQQQKKALMQQLLTGKRRLPGFGAEWKMFTIGDWLDEKKVKSYARDQHVVLTSSRNGLVRQSDYFGDSRITQRDNVGFNVIPPGYVTYRSRSDDGSFIFNKNDLGITGIVSSYYPVFRFPDGDDDFFVDTLNFYSRRFSRVSVGTSQKVLSINALMSTRLRLPAATEQHAIASVLRNASQHVARCTGAIAVLKKEKKALMQQLLTGKRRVVIE